MEIIDKHHICVCICTYKRPKLLRRLLSKIEEQETEGLFDISIVIVDNDVAESARIVVETWGRQTVLPFSYHVEPEQNIARARNMAIENAYADFVALIDDDELPEVNWLLHIYKILKIYNSDGIMGPVLPLFECSPPTWVIKGHFFDRPVHRTGHLMEWRNTRTGNVLLKRALFENNHTWFDPMLGSGGEDRDFFKRKIAEGFTFRWCNDAPVFEIIPPTRWKPKVLLKKAFLRGKMAFRRTSSKSSSVFTSFFAIFIYTTLLPFFLILGYHHFMQFLIKDFDHIGKVFTYLGIDLVKEKYIEG
ncbi:glycosyltransferase family 2 protein [candidate division KSB1 bacterium]|nr:glycosyltransferase family 2 protein [candidate division KSB1 bacterium]